MRIETVNTGTELLLGKVINTHAAFFGEELFKLGLRLQRQTAIPDGAEIETALRESFPRSDVILITGGLGPTNDDLTREVIAGMLRRELRFHQGILDAIEEMFASRGLTCTESNRRQAMVPDGAEIIENRFGTAPGLYLPSSERSPHLFLLPGPPRELHPMWHQFIVPRLGALAGGSSRPEAFRNFRICGVGESAIAHFLEPKVEKIPCLELGYCARLGEVDIRLIGSQAAIDEVSEILRGTFQRQIVTESEDSIAKVLIALLTAKGKTLATAESCTGGLIASTLTDESGSSAVFQRGYVTYANEAKSAMLGVPPETLATFGAVSEPTVTAMVTGCLRESAADYAIAVSGIAGPNGGSEEKPVGTVFIGIGALGEPPVVKRFYWPSERSAFKTRVTRMALDLLRQKICGYQLED